MAKKTTTLNIKFAERILGDPKGKKLFSVVRVDPDDSEDTTAELWRANNEDHLHDLVRVEYKNLLFGEYEEDEEDEEKDDEFCVPFEEMWGYTILPTLLGTIQ